MAAKLPDWFVAKIVSARLIQVPFRHQMTNVHVSGVVAFSNAQTNQQLNAALAYDQ